MEHVKYLILGAGPAGLAFANRMLQCGEDSFLVLEKETEAGGLCRSAYIDGKPIDIGGGHFLDTRRPEVNRFLFQFMGGEEWNRYIRDSQIQLKNYDLSYPFEANIWQLPAIEQVRYLKSIAIAGCNINQPMPVRFVDWIRWKLGDCIAEDYMLPYNRKMFGENLNDLSTQWLDKLPSVSFEDTLLSCLNKKMYGKQPGHVQFFYPKKFGYGELWKRMGDALDDRLILHSAVEGVDFSSRIVVTENGDQFSGDTIIFTIPWTAIKRFSGIPQPIQKDINKLRHSGIQIEFYPKNLDTTAQWIYCPMPEQSYHRILVRHNFCSSSHGYWTETNTDRVTMTHERGHFQHVNEYAYPLNIIGKDEILTKLLKWTKSKRVYGLGRWGEWQHFNSDVTVEKAIALADGFLK